MYRFFEGNLSTHLINGQGTFTRNHLLAICSQIFEAMAFLEESNIVHGDLYCRNVLVVKMPYGDNDPCVKVADFGEANFIDWHEARKYAPSYYEDPWQNLDDDIAGNIELFGKILCEIYSFGRSNEELPNNAPDHVKACYDDSKIARERANHESHINNYWFNNRRVLFSLSLY